MSDVTTVIDTSKPGQPIPDANHVLKVLGIAFPNVSESFVVVPKPSVHVVILEWLDGPSVHSVMRVLEQAVGSHKGIRYRRIVKDTWALRNFFHRTYRLPLDDNASYPSTVAMRVCPHHDATGVDGQKMLELLGAAVDLPYRGYTPRSPACQACGSENPMSIYCEECGEKLRKTGKELLEEVSHVPFGEVPPSSRKKFLHFRKGSDLFEVLEWIQHYDPEVTTERVSEFLRQTRQCF